MNYNLKFSENRNQLSVKMAEQMGPEVDGIVFLFFRPFVAIVWDNKSSEEEYGCLKEFNVKYGLIVFN